MALDIDQQLRLERIIEYTELTPSKLSEWEHNFVSDQQSRYAEHGVNMLLSEKQWGVLSRIENKLDI